MNAPTPKTAIRVTDCSKWFDGRSGQVKALDKVSLDITQGEFVVFLGPSGCGKSTLLRMLAGLELPSDGTIEVFGHKVDGPPPEVGMIFQSYTSFPWLSVLDNVAFGLTLNDTRKEKARETAKHFVRQVGLSKFENAYPSQLSGGMQQRVAIARALAMSPQVLLMDEPFGALDALTRVEMQTFLVDLWQREKKTVVFVTHDIDEAILLADRVVVLGAHPGHVHAIVPVNLPHPRLVADTEKPAFVELRHTLREMIFSMKAPTSETP